MENNSPVKVFTEEETIDTLVLIFQKLAPHGRKVLERRARTKALETAEREMAAKTTVPLLD